MKKEMKKLIILGILHIDKFLGLGTSISDNILDDEMKNPEKELEKNIEIIKILEEKAKTEWIEKILISRLTGIIISVGNTKSNSRFLVTSEPNELVREINDRILEPNGKETIQRGINGFKKNIPLVVWDLKCNTILKELIQLGYIVCNI